MDRKNKAASWPLHSQQNWISDLVCLILCREGGLHDAPCSPCLMTSTHLPALNSPFFCPVVRSWPTLLPNAVQQ